MAEQAERDRHGLDADEALKELDGDLSMEGLARQLSEMMGSSDEGWPGIEHAGQAKQKLEQSHRAAFMREAHIFRDTFSTPAGRECLEILKRRTILRRIFPANVLGNAWDALAPIALARDTENEFVWSIIEAIGQAEGKQPTDRSF